MVELLLSYGANDNEKDETGITVHHYVTHNYDKEIVEYLLSHGANANEKDNIGETALGIAIENNNKEIVDLLFFLHPKMYKKSLL